MLDWPVHMHLRIKFRSRNFTIQHTLRVEYTALLVNSFAISSDQECSLHHFSIADTNGTYCSN